MHISRSEKEVAAVRRHADEKVLADAVLHAESQRRCPRTVAFPEADIAIQIVFCPVGPGTRGRKDEITFIGGDETAQLIIFRVDPAAQFFPRQVAAVLINGPKEVISCGEVSERTRELMNTEPLNVASP